MKRRIYVTLIIGISMMLMSCALTPQDRINQDPVAFASLPNWEKDQVIKGEIAVGMSPSAVKLAWGTPQNVVAGQENGKFRERWVYSVQYSSPSPYYYPYRNFYGYHPLYYPPYYRNDYVRVETGHVLFEDNKVVSWERRK